MAELTALEDLPKFLPGKLLCASDALGWKHVALRAYHYQPQDVIVPAMRDFMIVGYQLGVTPMQRRFDGPWSRATCAPGVASLLTRAEPSHWFWSEAIEVAHVYFAPELMIEVAGELTGRPVDSVTLADALFLDDPAIRFTLAAIASEAAAQGLGGPLYVETLARAMIIHLLRHYAEILPRRLAAPGALDARSRARIDEFLDACLDQPIELKDLARLADLPVCAFARQFKRATGQAPYAYVLARRLARARKLLGAGLLPIKEVAARCGFSDQAHLTRLFLRATAQTPAVFRKNMRGGGV